jgi:RNA polymerase sigma-70 factor (ECF subfamily)
MHDYSDIELVKAVLQGNTASEEALYRRFSVPMFRVCLRYAANRPEAEDMLQEGFMRVFADLKDYREAGSLEGWIRRVVVRAALRWLRKRRAFEMADLPDEIFLAAQNGNGHHENLELVDESKKVVQCMQKLPTGYRTVLNLYAVEGYDHEEIAELLNINIGTSRSQLSKARVMLRKLLENERTVQRI